MKNKYLIVITAMMMAGCHIYNPKQEALMRADMLEQKGDHFRAQKLRNDAQDMKEKTTYFGKKTEWYERDTYNFPEMQVPQEKRNYNIKISTFNKHRE